MPRISATVAGVTYVIGGWTSFELSRRQIEKSARDSLPKAVEAAAVGGSEDAKLSTSGARPVTNNEYLCSVLHSVRKQTQTPLKLALKGLRDRLRGLERGREIIARTPTVTAEQVDDLLAFLDKPSWPLHAKHLVKFKDALASSGVAPDMPILRVEPFKERYVDPFNPRTKKDMRRKLEEFEVLLAQMASYVDKIAAGLSIDP
jgi:hypothetical protein